MKSHKTKIFAVVSFVVMGMTALCLTFCGGGGGGTPTPSGGLTAEDFPNVGICSTGTIDPSADTLKNALAAATEFIFIHKPYTSGGLNDANIPFICGKEGSWDPSEADAFDSQSTLYPSDLLSDILSGTAGSVFICNVGFGFDPGSASAGFHGATTFRGELKFTSDSTTYRVRLRFTVAGNDADKTLASLGLTPGNITLQDGEGNPLTTVADVISLFASNPTDVTVNVMSDSTVHITATGGIICAGTE